MRNDFIPPNVGGNLQNSNDNEINNYKPINMIRRNTIWNAILFLFFFSSCDKSSDIGQFDDAVVESESNQHKFKQITFTINVINNLGEYVNTNQIDSVKLKVNGKDWGVFKSESIDTTSKTKKITNNIRFSDSKINYLIIAPYILKTDKLETAGDFVNYLDNRIVLNPGDYVCEVSEVKFHDLNNQWVVFKPQVYKDFSVIDNTTSSFVGEISLTIK